MFNIVTPYLFNFILNYHINLTEYFFNLLWIEFLIYINYWNLTVIYL